MTPGLVVTAQGCTPTPFGTDAVTVQCPFTLANNGGQVLVIGVAAASTAGAVLSFQPVRLVPGAVPVSFPAPPSGATWIVAAQTFGQVRAEEDWSFVGIIVLAGLAGWTLGEIIAWIFRQAGWCY